MVGIARWNLSPETRTRFTQILDEAPRLGIDRDDVVAGGLPGLRAPIALKNASESISEKTRDEALADVQDSLRTLQHRKYPKLVSQFQARVLALQGRGSDTEVAHVARGEMVVPKALQNPRVMAALREAAEAHGVSMEMLLVGNAQNRINPETGAAEFGVMDWVSGLFHRDSASDNDYEREIAPAGGEGAVSRGAYSGIKGSNARTDYADKVHALGPYDYAERAKIKAETRARTPIEILAMIEGQRPELDRHPGSDGRANVPSPKYDKLGRLAGKMGRGLAVVNLGMATRDVATSEEPLRAAFANVGSIAGGILGGAAGGAAGTLGGLAAPMTVPASALAGSALGGNLGYQGGEAIYDALWDRFYKPRR